MVNLIGQYRGARVREDIANCGRAGHCKLGARKFDAPGPRQLPGTPQVPARFNLAR